MDRIGSDDITLIFALFMKELSVHTLLTILSVCQINFIINTINVDNIKIISYEMKSNNIELMRKIISQYYFAIKI